MLDTDKIFTFILGAFLGGIIAFASGFLRKFGEDIYRYTKNKFFPTPQEPVLVNPNYMQNLYKPEDLLWSAEDRIFEREHEGYAYFLDPRAKARIYFKDSVRGKTYLMIRPGSQKKAG